MKALIDGDILRYSIGCAEDEDGEPLKWPLVKARLDGKIKSIVEGAGADTYTVHMSGSENFRKELATIKPYKGNRGGEKPYWHDEIEAYLKSGLNHPVYIAEGMEADDSMGIAQCSDIEVTNLRSSVETWTQDPEYYYETIICTLDKDLNMIPGWHCGWTTKYNDAIEPYFVSEEDGWKFFFTQLLTGDSTDNIPGLYGVGPVHAKRCLEGITEPLSLYSTVKEQYEKRFGSYSGQFMCENADLLWILREGGVRGSDILQEFHEEYMLQQEVPDV